MADINFDDLVMLPELTEDALLQDLINRYNRGSVYTYIGDVVVSVNPYKPMPELYTPQMIESYRNRQKYEVPPHIYTIADSAYRDLCLTGRNQCIIISGESGAGKTVASKYVMGFIAAVSGEANHQAISGDLIKQRLLESNPLLEAFGNAKTLRNDNSSRFGKYMEIEFDFKGSPVGGKITNYLLEKSRVINPAPGERAFHIFYELLAGASDELIKQLRLTRKPENYYYLKLSDCFVVETLNDAALYKETTQAMEVMGITGDDQLHIMRIVAAILHLGNISFDEIQVTVDAQKSVTNDRAVLTEDGNKSLEIVSELLSLKKESLAAALTERTTRAKGETFVIPLNKGQACYARDALAKSLYDRLFQWIITQVNKSICVTGVEGRINTIGVLDIYGFEVLQRNSFEQLCINFCNEKLQQLFIELTLKSEQEEYAREGIGWVDISYFNNKIICDLIEKKPTCIISAMDEEVLLNNDDDLHLLSKMTQQFDQHPHFVMVRARAKTMGVRKTIGVGAGVTAAALAKVEVANAPVEETTDCMFTLKHYAGDVTYNVIGFLDKNKDQLFVNMIEAMQQTKDSRIISMFPENVQDQKKRPETAGTQFRNQLNNLMATLLQCQPHYIRTIKPNGIKAPSHVEPALFLHQVRYLGLFENVRVRRAGYAFRAEYGRVLHRYKCLNKDTWPNYSDAKDGSVKILQGIGAVDTDYTLGNSKLFIRAPQTVVKMELLRENAKATWITTKMQAIVRGFQAWVRFQKMKRLAIMIQAMWRAYSQRRKFLVYKACTIKVQSQIRGYQARTLYQRKRAAVTAIASVVKMKWINHQYLLEKTSAIKVEKIVRGYLAWLRLQRKKKCANHASRLWRGFVKRRAYLLQKASAIVIQKYYRRHTARKWYKSMRNAQITIAANVRMMQQSRAYKQKRAAAIKVEACMKQLVAQIKYRKIRTAHRQNVATMYMQRIARVTMAQKVKENRAQWNLENSVSYMLQRAALYTKHVIELPKIKEELEKEKARIYHERLVKACIVCQRLVRHKITKHFINEVAAANKEFTEKSTLVFPTTKVFATSSKPLEDLHKGFRDRARRIRIRKYKEALTPKRQAALNDKMTASDSFKGRKSAYTASVGKPFNFIYDSGIASKVSNAKYIGKVNNVDTKALKGDEMFMAICSDSIQFFDMKKQKPLPKETVSVADITGAHVSAQNDNLIVIKLKAGDLMLECLEATGAIEVATVLLSNKMIKNVQVGDNITVALPKDKSVVINVIVDAALADNPKGNRFNTKKVPKGTAQYGAH